MSKFIELHRSGKDESPILINVDYISRIHIVKNEVVIYLGLKSNEGNDTIIVKESFEKVKNLINEF